MSNNKFLQITDSVKHHLVEEALKARTFSYSPYSNFQVGAALLAHDGQIFTGCNIENAAYTPSNCAERTAVFKAVSQGVTQFTAIAIAGGPKGTPPLTFVSPCGVCRQVLTEFCDPDQFLILLCKGDKSYKEYTLSQLFPLGFSKNDLF